MIDEEVKISRETGEFHPLFLQYCLRILKSMRRAGQFSNMSQTSEVQHPATVNRLEKNVSESCRNNFADTTVVGRFGKDIEIEKEIGMSPIRIRGEAKLFKN